MLGSFGLFFTLFLLFTRFLPMISIGEVKSVLGHGRSHAHTAGAHDASQAAPGKAPAVTDAPHVAVAEDRA
jgi:hypothetical protein